MTVTLFDVICAATARAVVLAPETGGYLALAAADGMAGSPCDVELGGLELGEEGAVRVRTGPRSGETESARSLRRVLASLLSAASPGCPALVAASRRSPESDTPAAFVRELEAALIPVNRAAARRTLGRLHRETARAVAAGRLVPPGPQPEPSVQPTAAVAPARAKLPEPPQLPEPTVVVSEAELLAPPVRTPVVESYAVAPIFEGPWRVERFAEVDHTPFLGTTSILVDSLPPPPVEEPCPTPTWPQPAVLEEPSPEPAAADSSSEPPPPLEVVELTWGPAARGPVSVPSIVATPRLSFCAPVSVAPAEMPLVPVPHEESEPDFIEAEAEDDVSWEMEPPSIETSDGLFGMLAASPPPPDVEVEVEVETAAEPVIEPACEASPALPEAPRGVPEAPQQPVEVRVMYAPRRSDLTSLLSTFTTATTRSATDVARDLKRSVGIDATPGPMTVLADVPPRSR